MHTRRMKHGTSFCGSLILLVSICCSQALSGNDPSDASSGNDPSDSSSGNNPSRSSSDAEPPTSTKDGSSSSSGAVADSGLPLLCSSCTQGGSTTDFGGEPPLCDERVREIDVAEAKSLGYEVTAFDQALTGVFTSAARWKSEGPIDLTATIERKGSLQFLERRSAFNDAGASEEAQCPNALLANLAVDLRTSDSSIVATLVGKSVIAHGGGTERVHLSDMPTDLRGKLKLNYGELDPPTGLIVEFSLNRLPEVRMSVEVLAWYNPTPEEANSAWTSPIAHLSPIDGCRPEETRVDGGCVKQ